MELKEVITNFHQIPDPSLHVIAAYSRGGKNSWRSALNQRFDDIKKTEQPHDHLPAESSDPFSAFSEEKKPVQIANPLSPDSKDIFIDVGPFVHLPQITAAKKLGIPASTLSKRWREATQNRTWPHRILTKIDRKILEIETKSQIDNRSALALQLLRKQKRFATESVFIRYKLQDKI
eukprot:TRINITY_DN2111_c0_g1_i2.p1 TRINITY_DN2111_c0_g1~~TRINITY_DN2111_c0_g1_i2.p1  ORF type:complete len:177 (+),score=33.29 TRINITY_DN2111_c0_g1_i2:148-678(+)